MNCLACNATPALIDTLCERCFLRYWNVVFTIERLRRKREEQRTLPPDEAA